MLPGIRWDGVVHLSRKAPFPMQDMQIGDWFIVPKELERKLWQSAQYHKRTFGIEISVMLDQSGENLVVVRTT